MIQAHCAACDSSLQAGNACPMRSALVKAFSFKTNALELWKRVTKKYSGRHLCTAATDGKIRSAANLFAIEAANIREAKNESLTLPLREFPNSLDGVSLYVH